MSEPFIAEVRIFAGNFAPRSWAFCNGQLLPIAQNTALFSLVGTIYGGDGRTTFGLPNMQGRAPMHPGRGPGLTARQLGQKVGAPAITLNATQIPSHSHNAGCTDDNSVNNPLDKVFGFSENNYAAASSLGTMNNNMIRNTGGSQPHNNVQPLLTLNFIIALQGIYPSRS